MKPTVKWRLSLVTYQPEQVTVYPVSDDYVLIEGEDHTTYKGNLFDSPDQAFAAEIADAERSIRYGTEKKERVLRAQERFTA